MNITAEAKLLEHLIDVYGDKNAHKVYDRLMDAVTRFNHASSQIPTDDREDICEKDVILITYGDFIKREGYPPLQTLAEFLGKYLKNQISIVHILPFYPYSSDDGFSVIDYRSVNPELGSWEDVRELGKDYKLMFDAVINHISRESGWFKGFVDGDERYAEYFITEADTWDLSQVVRPRTSRLLTEVETVNGPKKVWTTFSPDQVDLNYENPDVFVEIIELLLFYIRQGAAVIRLDAIAYLWKESGTTCIHLPQTHRLIKVMRLIVDMIAPHVILITETNVPHEENIRYFGEINQKTGVTDEAHMVYQFPLAPLVLHTLMVGSSENINDWIDGLETSGLFMNFIASHDGIGVMPAIGLIDEEDVDAMVAQVKAHGGLVSYKSNPDGSQRVYELNTTLYDALNDPQNPDPLFYISRFIASQVIMVSLAGVPGIYFHSLLGSRNAHDHYHETGRARSINRKGFTIGELENILSDAENIHYQVFDQYKRILEIRTQEPAFHPRGSQKAIRVLDEVFALERESLDGSSKVLVLVNVTADTCTFQVDLHRMNMHKARQFLDLISGREFNIHQGKLAIALQPYQALWLKVTTSLHP
jgi:glucosylglycerate phosphorylase